MSVPVPAAALSETRCAPGSTYVLPVPPSPAAALTVVPSTLRSKRPASVAGTSFLITVILGFL